MDRASTRILISIAAVLVCAGIWPAEAAGPWRDDRPITVGHRGTSVMADENTMAAYAAAWEQGLDVFELDPKLTADGIYVIMHDETVDRTTNGHGKVADLTLAEIKQLRTTSGQEVPTFKEALDFAAAKGMGVYLDLKSPPPDEGALLVAMVKEAGMTDRVIAGCWQKQTCRMIEAREPAISTCVGWPWPALTLGSAARLGADAVGTLRQLASSAAVKAAHRRHLRVITMPINDEAQLSKFKARGIDALQTDDPRLVAAPR
jgi:glycerophosphoryl diester phosphodiesterase